VRLFSVVEADRAAASQLGALREHHVRAQQILPVDWDHENRETMRRPSSNSIGLLRPSWFR